MSRHADEGDGCGIVIAGLLCAMLGACGGCSYATDDWERKAVRDGKAEYYLDEHDNKKWRWRPELIGPPLPPEKL